MTLASGISPGRTAVPASLAAALVDICGPEGVVLEEDRLLVYESDSLTAYRHRPGAVALPRTTREVQRVVRAVVDHGLPLVPRGAGTGLSGGALALNGAVVLGTARMNRILEIDPENLRAVVQPGVINADLSIAAAPFGLCYAPDPSSETTCTIGGNVAENSGGPHCLKHGVTSRWITGLEVVLPDGSKASMGGRGRSPQGYDLVGLFVGSEGCFGIAVEIEVALLPVAEGVRTMLAVFDRLNDAGQAVSDVVGAGLLPAAMEIIDGPTIRAVEESVFAAGYPADAEAVLVVEFDGSEAGLDPQVDKAVTICCRAGARETRSARTEAERIALWKGRKKAFGAMGRITPDLMVQDVTVPRTKLPEVLGGIYETGERYGLVVANAFHAGDGNLHPNILFDGRDPDQLAKVEDASKEIMRLCIEAGGTITGEHGVGLDKKHHMPLVFGPDEIEIMWGVRRAFDPKGLMNPGKVLPDDTAPRAVAAEPRLDARARTGSRGSPTPVLALFPADRVLEGEAAREWCGGVPTRAVVFPKSVEEVRKAVHEANRAGVALTPAGCGSWLWADGWGREGDVAVSTLRLNAVRHYEPAELTMTAGAGLRWDALAKAAAANGQWLPVDSPGSREGTLGSLAATGASGPLQRRYGAVRDNVLGMEIVAGDGRVLRFGGRVVKNVAGYDVIRLLVGSQGSLGIVTELSVRLFPRPEAVATLLFRDARARIVEIARSVCTSSLPVASVEAVQTDGDRTIEKGRASGGGQLALAVRIAGNQEEVNDLRERLTDRAGVQPAGTLLGAESDAFHEERTRWEHGAPLVVRIALLPSLLARGLEHADRLEALLDRGELSADAAGGVVRVKGSPQAEDLNRLARQLDQASIDARALGGALSLANAPPDLTARLDGSCAGSAPRARRLKALFDPAGVLSPRCPSAPRRTTERAS